jgi:hypothetical protein
MYWRREGPIVAAMRRSLLLALIAVLALPAASASAAPVKISPKAAAVSDAGVASVEVANPNAHALRGTAALAAGGQTVASRSVRLGKRSVASLSLRLGAEGVEAVRAAGGRATLTLKLRGAGRKTTARRTLSLQLPAPAGGGAPEPGPAADPTPGKPASNHWRARMGEEGEYDDFEFDLVDGQITITKAALVPVSCSEMGGSYRIALSLEAFTATGPYTLGSDGLIAQQGIAVNQLVNSGAKTINYKMENTKLEGGKVTGSLGMSFSDSKLDILNGYRMIFINCAGSQSFEAIPA